MGGTVSIGGLRGYEVGDTYVSGAGVQLGEVDVGLLQLERRRFARGRWQTATLALATGYQHRVAVLDVTWWT